MLNRTLAVVALVIGVVGVVLGGIALTAANTAPVLQEAVFEHDEMTPDQITLIPGGLENSTVGDKRYYNVPATSPSGGMFTGTLTVMAENTPEQGKDLRETSLIFQMGNISDQIQIGGIAVYDMANPALKPGDVIIRPILGGTGTYAGATGWVETTHNADGGWKHVFHYTLS